MQIIQKRISAIKSSIPAPLTRAEEEHMKQNLAEWKLQKLLKKDQDRVSRLKVSPAIPSSTPNSTMNLEVLETGALLDDRIQKLRKMDDMVLSSRLKQEIGKLRQLRTAERLSHSSSSSSSSGAQKRNAAGSQLPQARRVSTEEESISRLVRHLAAVRAVGLIAVVFRRIVGMPLP